MLSQEIASQVLLGPDGHRVHHFGDPSTPIFRERAMDVVNNKEGYIRTWIEEKGAYGWLWRTSEGNLLEEKPGLSPIMQRLELHRAMDRASQQ